jgi:CelD/BcsL family acetyltransferase involved in cellulose biosynthesis
MTRHVAPKRRKDLARTWRRLAERGEVQHESHRSGGGLDGAIRAFLDIEAQGWKGGRGTALACDPLTQRFALEAFTGDAAHSICRADVLAVDGKAIAVSLAVIAGKVAYTVKCAYDETYRKYSPGLLLEVEVIRSFLADRWAERLDSAAGDGHIIGELWPDRIDVGDLVFALSPRFANGRLAILTRTEQWRRNFRETAKRWLGR